MPRIINSYIFKEISVPFLLSLLILTATALLSKVMKLVELIVTHGIGMSFIFWFIFSVIPSFLIYTIPISFLIGVLIAFTRLSSDSETVAMKASGLSLFNLMRPVLFLALLAYIAALACTLYLFPWGNMNLKRLMFDAAKTRLVSGIEEKTFYDRFKGAVLYVDHLNPKSGEMEGIFISQSEPGGSNIFFAQSGVFSPSTDQFSVYLKLENGTIHRKTEGNEAYHIADFASYTLELGLTGGEPAVNPADKPNRELYISELSKRISDIKAKRQNPAPYIIDLHKRLALPASVFVFAILGVPLGIQKIRAAKFTGFSVALGVILIYYVVSTAMEALGDNGVLNPVLSVWGSDILFGMGGLYVFYKAAKDAPVNLFERGGAFFAGLFRKKGRA